jgi:hypothetical protein
MLAAATSGQRHGAELISRLRERVLTDLVHDGCLSAAGARVVERVGLPMQEGKKREVLDDKRAAQLAEELLEFAQAHSSASTVC